MAAPELRPLRVGEVLDAAFKVYRRNALSLWKIIALVVVPVNVLGGLVMLSVLPDDFYTEGFGSDPESLSISTEEIWAFAAAAIVVALISIITLVAATGACLKIVSDAYLGGKSDAGSSLRFAARRLHSLVWIGFLTVLFSIVAAGLAIPGAFIAGPIAIIVLALPGVWLWFSWSVAAPALLVEDKRGIKALRRSFGLVSGRWWKVFWTLVLGYILSWIVSAAVDAVTQPLFNESETLTSAVMLETVVRSVSAILTTPFQAALVAIIYFDLRVRKEGFDLELLAQRIGTSPDPAGALSPGAEPQH